MEKNQMVILQTTIKWEKKLLLGGMGVGPVNRTGQW